jgi:hypothetical protein
MPTAHQSIDSIEVKIDALKEMLELRFRENNECHIRLIDHLAVLNGQTAKNTEWRIRMKAIISFWGFVLPLVVSFVIAYLGNQIF